VSVYVLLQAFSRHHFIKDHEEDCSNAYDPQLMVSLMLPEALCRING